MNNLRELTNREYLSNGKEIQGRGQGGKTRLFGYEQL